MCHSTQMSAIEIHLILSKSTCLEFLVMSTQTHRQMVDFSWKKTRKNIYSKKTIMPKNESCSNISLTSFFQMDKNKTKTKKLCKQDTKGALSLFEGF